jgi:cleavage stimulation factor subunit 3
MDALRKIYHRAIQIPLENIERLWSELEAFENSLKQDNGTLLFLISRSRG